MTRSTPRTPDVWSARRARALELMRTTPHAEEILAVYVGLVELQARVAEQVRPAGGSPPAERPGDGSETVDAHHETRASTRRSDGHLLPERLRLEELLSEFERFLADVATIGTDVINAGSATLLAAGDNERLDALRAVLDPGPTVSPEANFHGRAFLEAVFTTLAQHERLAPRHAGSGDPDDAPPPRAESGPAAQRESRGAPRRCPTCRAAPLAATLRDRPDVLGSRALLCSLCATEWRYPRLTCTSCGETDAGQLLVHTSETVPHVRLDECRSCSRYLKTIDVRAEGRAVPAVDELATVELDLWARDRGLTKIQLNVLGL